ncbi:MAG: hypothetical protein JXB35_07820, partial [Anaerolineae bacterium]|nr:hypothetical protein [Anaerolineae bacterium]
LGAPFTALVAASLACLLNPRGLDMVNYLTAMSANTIIQNLTPEWSPPTFDTVKGILFFAALLGTAAVLAISPKRPSVREMLSFLGIAALGLKTFRGAIWYGLIVAPILARHLPSIIREANRSLFPRRRSEPRPILATPRETVLNVTFAGLLLLGGFSSLPWFKSVWPLPPEKAGLLSNETPVAAVAYMAEAELPPQVFHAMPFGSYLAWAAQPEYPVFVDSRIELYPPEVWFDYLAISAAAEGWEAKLSAYGIHTLMLSQQLQPALVQAAAASSEWTEVYQDATCVVFVRSE